uniref:Alpha-MPP n=1 Tax=Pinguiococcus pyrenoidosus TaxID=172671 RepID=A0A7R9UE84_9STRA
MLPRVARSAARSAGAPAARRLSLVALEDDFPAAPAVVATAPKALDTQLGNLNGLPCVSLSGLGPAVRYGIVVAAGSRHEMEGENGAAHVLRKMALLSTAERSDLKLFRDLEALGATTQTAVDREYLMYSITCPPEVQAKALTLLSEAVMAPSLFDYELKKTKPVIEAELGDLAANKESYLLEAAHEASFGFNGLGNSLYATDGIPSADAVRAFYERNLVVENMVLVGAGAEIDAVKTAAATYFGEIASGAKASGEATTFGAGDVRIRVPGAPETLYALSYGFAAAEGPSLEVLAEIFNQQAPPNSQKAVVNTYSDASLLTVMGSSESKLTADAMKAALATLNGLSISDDALTGAMAKLEVEAAIKSGTMAGAVLPAGLAALFGTPAAATAEGVKAVASKIGGMTPAVAAVGKASAVPRASELI